MRGEKGQAMVELAIAAPVFLLIVFGVIQFGLALNFWLDMQRMANQGARWAAVDRWPGCTGAPPCSPTLQQYLVNQEIANSLNATVRICFPNDPSPNVATYTGVIGDAVKVKVTRPYTVSIIGMDIDLAATATMRLEQKPTRYTKNLGATC